MPIFSYSHKTSTITSPFQVSESSSVGVNGLLNTTSLGDEAELAWRVSELATAIHITICGSSGEQFG